MQMLQPDASTQNAINENTAAGIRGKDLAGVGDCETCKSRTYQDRSSDGGVSMQSPTQLSPEEAASAVMSHEREHAARDAAQAKSEGRDVIYNNIRLFSSICPECGKTYISGGQSQTVTEKKPEEQQGLLQQPGQLMDILM
jgi:hypothetical protein